MILKVLATRERDLDDALIRKEIEQLIEEIPDHDIRGRFAALSQRASR